MSDQIAAATQALEDLTAAAGRANEAVAQASHLYNEARRNEPASQATDQARQDWADALTAWVTAHVDHERARDELHALKTQDTDYEGATRA
jgi:hypothetical protein